MLFSATSVASTVFANDYGYAGGEFVEITTTQGGLDIGGMLGDEGKEKLEDVGGDLIEGGSAIHTLLQKMNDLLTTLLEKIEQFFGNGFDFSAFFPQLEKSDK